MKTIRVSVFDSVLAVALAAAGLGLPACKQDPSSSARPAARKHVPRPKGADLLAGAKWEFSLDRGQTWTAAFAGVDRQKAGTVLARTRFSVAEPSAFAFVELAQPARAWLPRMTFALNGRAFPAAPEGMVCQAFPPLPAECLRKGENTLSVEADPYDLPYNGDLGVGLYGLRAEDLEIRTGPILGHAGSDFFTVTCRTNMPVTVKLTAYEPAEGGAAPAALADAESQGGLVHRFRMAGLKAGPKCTYTLTAACGGHTVTAAPYPVTLLPPAGGKLRVVAMGDCRSHPDRWHIISEAARKEAPDLVAFTGDMVDDGRLDWEWDDIFWQPAKELLASAPFYPVLGNHDADAPVCDDIFYPPKGDGLRQWSQRIGDVLLIGVDGTTFWGNAERPLAWLEKTLADSDAKFIFLLNHYPPNLPGRGRFGLAGAEETQDPIVALLRKHSATAMIVGHEHNYQRLEIPADREAPLSVVITGGAGAPLYGQGRSGEAEDPYCKAFASTLHYCVVEVAGDTCTLRAKTPEGEVLDTRTWTGRKTPTTRPTP